ncbi:glycine-N-acyltransferase-like protein 3 [Topomyia yanbarensis]|uniref:glycine-N-acyltransferase-like protein 3 n=1 Tax=Topomyia yanbarensis TaxID=2498891 RepID=UPI00273B1D07|nr:glycine-N-acyltransferase-like protein 3 [Topomyia yanbarensis]
MENCLVEIPSENWPELRNLYRNNWPEHVYAYGIVNNYIRWKSSDHSDHLGVKILSLNGRWRENGTFLLFDDFEIYFYSLDVQTVYQSLTEALCLVPWESYSEVSMDFMEQHRIALDKAISMRKLNVVQDSITNFYYISKENANTLLVERPVELRFDRISVEYLDYIYNQWALKESISQSSGYNLLKRLILLNDSVGLFDEAGNLVSWCLRDQSGALSDLQTSEPYFRKGYGRAVVSELARRLSQLGDDSYALVFSSNYKSCRLFEVAGFRKMCHAHWVVVRQMGQS